MVIYVSILPWIPAYFWKWKGRIEIFSSERESKYPNETYMDILGFL